MIFILSGGVTTLWRGQGQGSVAIPVSWPGVYLEKGDSSLPCQEQRANPLLSIKHSKWDYFIHSFNHGLIIQYMPGTVLDERYNDEQRSTLALAFLKFTI